MHEWSAGTGAADTGAAARSTATNGSHLDNADIGHILPEHPMIGHELKRAPDEPDHRGHRDTTTDDEEGSRPKRFRIRCPKCAWEPRPHDRWYCTCGHTWNTFDTAGRCPACDYQWRDTACLTCHEWSRHVDWYETDPDEDL